MVQRNVTVGTLPRKQQGNTFTLCGLNHRKFRVCLCQPRFKSLQGNRLRCSFHSPKVRSTSGNLSAAHNPKAVSFEEWQVFFVEHLHVTRQSIGIRSQE